MYVCIWWRQSITYWVRVTKGVVPSSVLYSLFPEGTVPFWALMCPLALLKILWCDLWPLSILYYSPFLSDCWSICNAFTFESIKPLKSQLRLWYGFVVLVATHTRTVCCIGSAVGWGQRSVHAIVSRPPGVPFGVKVLVGHKCPVLHSSPLLLKDVPEAQGYLVLIWLLYCSGNRHYEISWSYSYYYSPLLFDLCQTPADNSGNIRSTQFKFCVCCT